MGSSGSGDNKEIDIMAGGLVWVRRRNGSWWPGKILTRDELPEGSMLTPKSGTPIKLLGKKRTTVDWYNLEKSKRVKTFHCAEYADCIEKAKVSASHSSKNGVKKAKREEAILHALELESALDKDHPQCSATPSAEEDGQRHEQVDESTSTLHPGEESGNLDEVLSCSDDSELNQQVSKSVISFEEQDLVKDECKKLKTANDSEEDGPGVKRMRGLQDLGVGIPSSLKRKRSQVAHVQEFLKKKNRRRPLTKVLECSLVLSSPIKQFLGGNGSGDRVPSDSKVSEVESNESMKNISVKIKNTPDSNGSSCRNVTLRDECMHAAAADTHPEYKQKDIKLSCMQGILNDDPNLFDVSLVTDEKLPGVVSDASEKAQVGARAQSSQSSLLETSSLGSEEKYESACTSSAIASIQLIDQSTAKATSDWLSKGKRNSRPRKVDDEADMCTTGIGNLPGWNRKAPCEESQARGSKTEFLAPQRLLPHRLSRYTVNPKYESTDFSLRRHVAGSCLFDIVVEVKSSYRPQHVPYISLMSMVSNLPITGHPVTVKVLEEGSSNDLISFSECYSSNSEMEYSLHGDVPPVDEQQPRGKLPSKRHTSNVNSSSSKSTRLRKSGILSKKTRKLSSLTSSHGRSREVKKPAIEKVKGPSIACIPLKIVFSRINAALSSSFQPAPHLPATSGLRGRDQETE